MVEPGRRCLGDRYELDRMIAAGGMGQVWRAQDIALHRTVAVKVLRSEYTGDPTFVARFRAEAQHAASLSHPNTAAVFDYGEATAQDGTGETLAYLVMELVEGEPLSNLLAREGRLDTATTLSILRQTAFALGDAHRAGMVHRDVKPGNILVRPDGSVKITDFGIAWSARSVALTRTGQVIGTPQYLSPEQAEGKLATPASDVYALGLIGYECLVGHPAFEGDNAVTIALKQVQQEPEPLPGIAPRRGAGAHRPGPAEGSGGPLRRRLRVRRGDRGRPGGAPAARGAAHGRRGPGRLAGTAPAFAVGPTDHRVAAGRGPHRFHERQPLLRAAPGSAPSRPVHRWSCCPCSACWPARESPPRCSRHWPGTPRARRRRPPTCSSRRPRPPSPSTPTEYIGRPVDEVVTELTDLGLNVERRQVPTSEVSRTRSPTSIPTERWSRTTPSS